MHSPRRSRRTCTASAWAARRVTPRRRAAVAAVRGESPEGPLPMDAQRGGGGVAAAAASQRAVGALHLARGGAVEEAEPRVERGVDTWPQKDLKAAHLPRPRLGGARGTADESRAQRTAERRRAVAVERRRLAVARSIA
eukprot:7378396-Prymnesium_polylepis.1